MRDYRHPDPETTAAPNDAGERRDDKISELRLRLELPFSKRLSFRTEYVFRDSSSNLPSADYESNRVEGMLRFELE
jgi:hypothetical protein